jgi:hypothetical protein
MQMPLMTRATDKRRHRVWRQYVLVNELLVLGLAFASLALQIAVNS